MNLGNFGVRNCPPSLRPPSHALTTLSLCAGEPDLQPWSPPWLTRLKQLKEEISDGAQRERDIFGYGRSW